MDDLVGEFRAPFLQKPYVLFPVPKIVWEHHGYLIDDRIISRAPRAGQYPIDDNVAAGVEFKKLQGVVLVYGTSEDVKELPLHGLACFMTSKNLGALARNVNLPHSRL